MTWLLFMNAVPLACVVAAGAIAVSGQDGWCWFLIVALCTGVVPSRITFSETCERPPQRGPMLRRGEGGVYRPEAPPPGSRDPSWPQPPPSRND